MEAQNSGEQRYKEICGRERDGEGVPWGMQDGHNRVSQEGKQGL